MSCDCNLQTVIRHLVPYRELSNNFLTPFGLHRSEIRSGGSLSGITGFCFRKKKSVFGA